MRDRTIGLWTIAACMSATAVLAQAPAPTTTAFDGTNVGVSRTAERPVAAEYTRLRGSYGTRSYTPNGQPGAPTNDESAGPVFYGTPHAGFAVAATTARNRETHTAPRSFHRGR